MAQVVIVRPTNLRSDPRRPSASIVGGATALSDQSDASYVDLLMDYENTAQDPDFPSDFAYRNDYVLGDLPAVGVLTGATIISAFFNVRAQQVTNNDPSGSRLNVESFGAYPDQQIAPLPTYKVTDSIPTLYSHSLEEVDPFLLTDGYAGYGTTPGAVQDWLIAGTGQMWVGLLTPLIQTFDDGTIYHSIVRVYEAWIEVTYEPPVVIDPVPAPTVIAAALAGELLDAGSRFNQPARA